MTALVQEYNKRVINLGILCSAVCDTVAVGKTNLSFRQDKPVFHTLEPENPTFS